MIEEDIESHFGDGAIFELVKKYGEENNIFLKGVNKLLREFRWIEKEYWDDVEITPEIIKKLFAVQPSKYKFEYGWNKDFGTIVSGRSVCVPINNKCYATPSPITIRLGRLVEMVTSI